MLGIRSWLLVVTFSGISFAAPDGGDEVCKSLNDHFESVAWPSGTWDFHGSYGKNGRIDPQAHHAKHNFILIGRDEVFASHVVYKAPHNYQVLLQITFGESVKTQYLDAKARYPLDNLFLLLDEMDLSKINQVKTLDGVLLRRSSDATSVIVPNVKLTEDDFKILYFDELPTNLGD